MSAAAKKCDHTSPQRERLNNGERLVLLNLIEEKIERLRAQPAALRNSETTILEVTELRMLSGKLTRI